MRQFGIFSRSRACGIIAASFSRLCCPAIFVMLGCGGSSPPASSAESVPVATATTAAPQTPPPSAAPAVSSVAPANPSPAEPQSTQALAPAESQPTPAPSASPEPPPNPDRSPTATVTAAGAAFLLDYANSEAKTKAEAGCAKDPKNEDPAAKAACLGKARTHFLPDVLVFKSDKKGHESLTIYKREDSLLREVFSAPVSLKDEGPNLLQVKFKGAGNGQRPLFRGTNSPTIRMPNSYTLEIDDPQYGKLVYEAKIGLVN